MGKGADARRGGRAARWAALLTGAVVLPLAAWVVLHEKYDSWHPCDWLLVDRVALILRREGIDPDTASIPLRAGVAESAEVRAVLHLRSTPLGCLGAWAAGRALP